MRLLRTSIGIIGLGMWVVAGGALVSGCASDTEAKREEARSAAGTFRASLGTMPGQIDATMSKLAVLTDNRTADKSTALSEYRTELAKMDSDARRLGQEADHATKDADAYFRQWAREAAVSANKQETAGQSVEVKRAHYETARSYLENARQRYLGLTQGLHNIERMYAGGNVSSTDPAVSAAIEQATQDSVYVKNYIARLGEQIDTTLRLK
jgi:hypothetical protein